MMAALVPGRSGADPDEGGLNAAVYGIGTGGASASPGIFKRTLLKGAPPS